MKRMLIDAAHAEETRVVIVDNNKIDDFEVETLGKQQLKGNIYIGHVSRVEPSLQAAFITYGGNRNGFLAFGEVHPQFFALKDAEKAQLLEEVAEQAARRRGMDRDLEDGDEPETRPMRTSRHENTLTDEAIPATVKDPAAEEAGSEDISDEEAAARAAAMADEQHGDGEAKAGKPRNKRGGRGNREGNREGGRDDSRRRAPRRVEARNGSTPEARESIPEEGQPARRGSRKGQGGNAREGGSSGSNRLLPIHRRYRIQDVLKEGQKILVQVVKEERGSKGAALTTYFSLPGRYTVLMPNTPYAGGISRKITDPEERRQLRDAYAELKVPDTMGLIIRTAGVGQEISHIRRDYENLTNLWQHIIKEFEANDDIQCVHEDGSVIIRALRDMMSDDIDEIIVAGARAYKMAKDYAKNLMPDAVKLIKQHKDESQLFTAMKVESKLNQLHHTRVTLPSGGYMVINPTEALVAVDINSGRATQERNIEETALKTNLEACDELARQIRLRDLAGLIVVDFIDMEDHRNNRKVENAMRKALRRDRARIQTGSISGFGLMEISRQRLRPSFGESHFLPCPHCLGSGMVHSPATSALMVLRRLEEDDIRGADRVIITSSTELVLWLLNHKRDLIRSLEERYKYQLQFKADPTLIAPDHKLELVRIKADGTESSQTINVTLREQPELPPEKRSYRDSSRRRDRDDEESSDRREREPRESREGKDAARENRPAREEGDRRNRRRGSAPEGEAAAPVEGAEAPAKPEGKGGRRPRRTEGQASSPAEKAPARTKPQAAESAKPARPVTPPKDEPLAVQKVAVEKDEDTPIIPSAPRRKFEVKKQADTDADDAPLAVQKIASDDATSKASTKAESKEGKAAPAKKPASGGLISRLIGR